MLNPAASCLPAIQGHRPGPMRHRKHLTSAPLMEGWHTTHDTPEGGGCSFHGVVVGGGGGGG